MTKLQEELEAESMNELEWQCQSQINEDPIARRVSQVRITRSSFTRKQKRDRKATLNSQLKDKSEDGGKEKIEKSVQDTLGLVRQESEAEKYRNEDETNKAKIKAKNRLENCCFTAKNTQTEEKLKNKFARREGRDAGYHEQV